MKHAEQSADCVSVGDDCVDCAYWLVAISWYIRHTPRDLLAIS